MVYIIKNKKSYAENNIIVTNITVELGKNISNSSCSDNQEFVLISDKFNMWIRFYNSMYLTAKISKRIFR